MGAHGQDNREGPARGPRAPARGDDAGAGGQAGEILQEKGIGMARRTNIGMAKGEREVMCQGYEQAKVHPNNEATPSDDRLIPVWDKASHVFDQKGYKSSPFLQTAYLYTGSWTLWFSLAFPVLILV